jgi:ribose transport system permease protein
VTRQAQDPIATTRNRQVPPRNTALQVSLSILSRFGLAVLTLILIGFFSIESPSSFFTVDTARFILANQSVILIAALGIMLTLMVGEFDLSVAANLSLANVLVVGLSQRQGLPVWIAVLVALAGSTVVGVVNGFVVTRLHVNAFVATLGMATFLAGVCQLYLGNTDIFEAPHALTRLARGELFHIPLSVYYALFVAICLHLVLRHTNLGRRMLAVGGNVRAAEFAGINARRYRFGAFVAGGCIIGVAGIVLGATVGSASSAGSTDLLLPIFAAALLGSTTVTPGRYNVPGLAIAVLFLAITVAGLQDMGVPTWIQPMFNGAALVAAVALSGAASRARTAQARRRQLAAIADELG